MRHLIQLNRKPLDRKQIEDYFAEDFKTTKNLTPLKRYYEAI